MYLLKYIIIGDSGTGKTSIATRFNDNSFYTDTDMTIGVDFFSRVITFPSTSVSSSSSYKIQLFDTAGQERFTCITRSFFKDCCGVILTYDVTNKQSLYKAINYWLPLITKECSINTKIILVGNKNESTKRQVDTKEGETMTKLKRINDFCECSAKKGDIMDIFYKLTEMVMKSTKDDDELPIGLKWISNESVPMKVVHMKDDEDDERKEEESVKSSCCLPFF